MFHKKLEAATLFVAKDKTALREIMHPVHDQIKVGYSIAHASIAVGAASLPHQLKSSETYYILEGEGRMYLGGSKREVGKNDVFWVPPKVEQYLENTGDIPLVFLCIVEPFWKDEDDQLSD
jgi:mannose-6-phosphate isomerase-like protein (cupin superfamily)